MKPQEISIHAHIVYRILALSMKWESACEGKSRRKFEEDVARKVGARRKCGIAHAEGARRDVEGRVCIKIVLSIVFVVCLVSVGKTDVVL